MLYKDDNLEELFQKAADEYPLKTDNAEWDRFAAKWNAAVKQNTSAKTKMLKYALLLLLLGGASLLVYKYMPVNTKQNNSGNRYSSDKNVKGRKQNTIAKESYHNDLSVPKAKVESFSKINNSSNQNQLLSTGKRDYSMLKNLNDNTQQIVQNTNNNLLQQPNSTINNQTQQQAENNTVATQPELIIKNTQSSAAVKAKAAEDRQQQANIQLKQSYRIYGLLYGGPEFSTVKFQHVEQPGYKIGIGIGYRINNKISVELGLQREHLNFYSNGRYIDTGLLRIKHNTDIETVDANSKLTSVPVTIRYNFPQKTNGHFFAAAGVNAIIITHREEYKYAVSKNGVPANLSKNYSSLRNPKYFTGINVSAGYEKKLSGLWNLKFEPYYQAPINDLGVGRLPVSNFGIDIGIVKNLK